ncbi:MAG: orotidine 5'-phosphate decarboxylase / HUMPS family protein, partial [Longimicrobiales bacterium]
MSAIIVALDLPSGEQALDLVDGLGDSIGFYKVGSPLFTRSGPQFITELRDRGKRVFLDLKYHDIPSTVANAVESAARLDVELITVHASGGDA